MTKLTFHCGAVCNQASPVFETKPHLVYRSDMVAVSPIMPDGSLAPCVQACPKKRPSGRKVKRIFVDKYAPLGYLITCVPSKVEEVK